ncbi:MAG: hypothetical protein JST01_12045 [Cyanobacteria bacterium SZAS TMP-1]|nr:hypothetical protein [Cyanobacteria bacterium SZAS TMP-1]
MNFNSPLIVFLVLCLLPLMQACGTLAQEPELKVPAKPLLVIKVDRDKNIEPSAAQNVLLDKYFADEIEQPGLSHDRFDRLLAEAIVKTESGQSIVGIKDHVITVKYAGGLTGDTYTDNAWATCKNMPGQRKASLRTMLFGTKEVVRESGKHGDLLSSVVPIIRSSAIIDEVTKIKMPGDGRHLATMAWYPLAPGLICLYAVDSPNSLAMLPAAQVAKLGLTADDMKKGPFRTLLAHLPTDISIYSFDGLFMPVCGGDFESSLILDDELMSTVKSRVKGRLVFGVSTKDLVLLTGDADPANVKKLRKSIERHAQASPRAVSDKLYYWDDGKISLCP